MYKKMFPTELPGKRQTSPNACGPVPLRSSSHNPPRGARALLSAGWRRPQHSAQHTLARGHPVSVPKAGSDRNSVEHGKKILWSWLTHWTASDVLIQHITWYSWQFLKIKGVGKLITGCVYLLTFGPEPRWLGVLADTGWGKVLWKPNAEETGYPMPQAG